MSSVPRRPRPRPVRRRRPGRRDRDRSTSAPPSLRRGRSSPQYAGPLILIVADHRRRSTSSVGLSASRSIVLRSGSILVVVVYIVGQILTIGIINASLMVTRGRDARRRQGVHHRPPRASSSSVSILYGIIVGIGLILCVIPGIIAAIAFFGFYAFYFLDQGMSGTDALSASYNLVKDNFGRVFLVLLVAFLVDAASARCSAASVSS